MLWVPFFIVSWTLKHLDTPSAKTTIRLWNEIYVLKKVPHDFVHMISPENKGFYIGAVKHEEIRAIALCTRNNLSSVSMDSIAFAPEQLDAARELMKMLRDINTYSDLKKMKNQPRWYCEDLYYRNY